jgi:crossover junction endodeoxyribonuclease RuvC
LPATEVKKAVTGYGHASKEQIQRAVQSQCGLAEMPSPPDVADAIAIALTHGRRRAIDRATS